MIQRRFNIWMKALQNLCLDKGLIDGHREYERFVILGRARTGSNFLRGLLNSHSQVVAFGEIFREYEFTDYDTIGWDYPGYGTTKHLLHLVRSEPVFF